MAVDAEARKAEARAKMNRETFEASAPPALLPVPIAAPVSTLSSGQITPLPRLADVAEKLQVPRRKAPTLSPEMQERARAAWRAKLQTLPPLPTND